MLAWLVRATGVCLLATGCGRPTHSEDLLAFVPDDALLFGTIESIESCTEAFEELGGNLLSSRPRRWKPDLRSRLAEEAEFKHPDAIDPAAPVGFVLLEEGGATVPVWLLPLKELGDSREPASWGISDGPAAVHGRVAILSSSEEAVRRCEPRGASSRLAPALQGALHVVVDARRLVDLHRNAIDAGLRKWEGLLIELPQTVSTGSKVPPPPTAKIAEALCRAARHTIFGTDRAEIALDLRGGRLRLEAGARVREGSRAEAALARLPARPILLDRLPEMGDMILQFSTTRGPVPELVTPMFDWMVDGLAEPSRSELRGAWERVGFVSGVGVASGRVGPDGVDALTLLRCDDPQEAFRDAQEYFAKLASLAEFFRKAEEAPLRFEVGEPVRWEHAGHAVEERRFVQEARDADSPMTPFLRMWSQNSTICTAVVGDLFVTSMGPGSADSMRRAVDHVSARGRTAPPPRVREWLSRIPPEASLLCAMDFAAVLRTSRAFQPEPLPFPPPDRPLWCFLDFTAQGREARAGLDIDLRGFLEAARPR